jgi:hypothetical protein
MSAAPSMASFDMDAAVQRAKDLAPGVAGGAARVLVSAARDAPRRPRS